MIVMRTNSLERAVTAYLAWQTRRRARKPFDVHAQRKQMNRFAARAKRAPGTVLTQETISGIPVVRLSSGASARGVVLSLHGGAYVTGSARDTTLVMTSRAGYPDVVSVEYRLCPEHSAPAALEDALAVYRALLEDIGAPRIVVHGDSAGAGLALALLQAAATEGLPMPAALVAVYPWADLTFSGASWHTNAGKDVLSRPQLLQSAQWYSNEIAPEDPRVSPLFGSFLGFPPTYIPVGTRDLLVDDSRRVAKRMNEQKVSVQLDEFEGAPHAFNVVPLPAGRECNTRIHHFIGAALPARPTPAAPPTTPLPGE